MSVNANYFDNPDNHAIAWLIDGTAFQDPSSAIYAAYNAWSGDVTFQFPSPGVGKNWFRVMDTSTFLEPDNNIATSGLETRIGGASTPYKLGARAVLFLISE